MGQNVERRPRRKGLRKYGKTADAGFTLRDMNVAYSRLMKEKKKPDLIICHSRESWIWLRCGNKGTQKEKNKAGRAWDQMYEILTEKTGEK